MDSVTNVCASERALTGRSSLLRIQILVNSMAVLSQQYINILWKSFNDIEFTTVNHGVAWEFPCEQDSFRAFVSPSTRVFQPY